MWLFTQHGFFSVVRDPGTDDTLASEPSTPSGPPRFQVRARHRAHIDGLRAAFPGVLSDATVIAYDDPEHEAEYGGRDYEYRLFLTEEAWVALAAELAADIGYSNFKGAVHERSGDPSLAGTQYESNLYPVYNVMERSDRY